MVSLCGIMRPVPPRDAPQSLQNVDELLPWNSFNDLKLGPLKLAW